MATEQANAFPVNKYHPETAADIGQLMVYTDPSYSGVPIPQKRLESIITSPYHDQLIAVRDGRIAGAATMSIILEPGFESVSHLEAFVTDPRVEDKGVDDELWGAVEMWSAAHGASTIEFKSKKDQDPAFQFFVDKGSKEVKETALLRRDIPAFRHNEPTEPIGPLKAYSDKEAADLGRLMHQLDENFLDEPIPRDRLERIITSPYHDQLIAVRNGRIVGAATMSLLKSPTSEGVAYLGAFVTDTGAQNQGVGGQLWEDMERWTAAQGIPAFEFKSELDRQDAHKFYKSHGAPIVDDGSTFFEYTVPHAA